MTLETIFGIGAAISAIACFITLFAKKKEATYITFIFFLIFTILKFAS